MKNNRLKNAKAITLIALVVTIIVLLILAGVSIMMLTGDNGILTNAQQTSTQSAYKGAEEQVKIAYMAVKTEIMAKIIEDGTYDPSSRDNTQKLANIVRQDLGLAEDDKNGNGTWKVDDTTDGEIKITYTDSKIDQGVIGTVNLTQLDGQVSPTVVPRYEGVVHYQINLLPTQDAKLYVDTAPAEAPVAQTYTITYLANTGSGEMAPQSKTEGVDYTIAANSFTAPTGKVFKNWNTAADGNGTSYSAGATYSTNASLILYAQWKTEGTVDEVGDGTSTVYYKGSGNWEVFFKDNGRTYLIYKGADAYASLNAPKLGTKNWSDIYSNKNSYYSVSDGTHTHLTDYLVKSADSDRFKPATQAGWLNKYMTWLGDGTTNYSDAGNMAFTLFMLDQNVWKYGTLTPDSNSNATAYYDPNCADWVIGGPTMEMMVATANTGRNQSYSCNVEQADGYSVSGISSSNSLPAGTLWNHTSGRNYHYYWLACPCCSRDSIAWGMYGYNSIVNGNGYGTNYGFRPVVCLKSGVTLTTEGASAKGTTYVLKLISGQN